MPESECSWSRGVLPPPCGPAARLSLKLRDRCRGGFDVGAGLKHGYDYGATDEIGYKAVENPVHWHDFHATVLHLLGIDHERLTFYHNGIRRGLTDVTGRVVQDLLG